MFELEKVDYRDVEAINRYSSDLLDLTGGGDVTKEMIAAFADTTNNHQWIHEPHPYSQGDPYGGQIAHGLLLLSLIPGMLKEHETVCHRVEGTLKQKKLEIVGHRVRVIRGIEKVRFPHYVRPEERVYLSSRIIKAYAAPSGKGTIIEREIQLWTDNVVLWPETVLTCILKLQYF